MPILNQLSSFLILLQITTKPTAQHQSEGAFMCLVLVINRKLSNTLVVRVQQVEESGPLFPPVGRALLRHHGASFLSLWQHRVAPLKPHLRQKKVAADASDQEA